MFIEAGGLAAGDADAACGGWLAAEAAALGMLAGEE